MDYENGVKTTGRPNIKRKEGRKKKAHIDKNNSSYFYLPQSVKFLSLCVRLLAG